MALILAGCPGDDGTPSDTGNASSGPTTTVTASSGSGPGSATDVQTSGGSTTDPSTSGVDGTGDPSGDTTEGPATTGGGIGVDCPSQPGTLACGDGKDNDGDGLIDLFDPECIGPCDDDEGSFQTGIPGDNMDCNQDCFFDGNSGHGDDGCQWSLTCDPANPGAGLEPVSCEYNPGPMCDNMSTEQSKECLEFCTPYVPPGCDCFGCCTIQTPEGEVNIFLNSEPPCSLENLEACNECTPQIEDCGNPCEPELCEQCFGQLEPPEGCKDPGCPGGDPCVNNEDCPMDYFCYIGCCYPPPQG